MVMAGNSSSDFTLCLISVTVSYLKYLATLKQEADCSTGEIFERSPLNIEILHSMVNITGAHSRSWLKTASNHSEGIEYLYTALKIGMIRLADN